MPQERDDDKLIYEYREVDSDYHQVNSQNSLNTSKDKEDLKQSVNTDRVN